MGQATGFPSFGQSSKVAIAVPFAAFQNLMLDPSVETIVDPRESIATSFNGPLCPSNAAIQRFLPMDHTWIVLSEAPVTIKSAEFAHEMALISPAWRLNTISPSNVSRRIIVTASPVTTAARCEARWIATAY